VSPKKKRKKGKRKNQEGTVRPEIKWETGEDGGMLFRAGARNENRGTFTKGTPTPRGAQERVCESKWGSQTSLQGGRSKENEGKSKHSDFG